MWHATEAGSGMRLRRAAGMQLRKGSSMRLNYLWLVMGS